MSTPDVAPVERVIARLGELYARWSRHTTVGQMRSDWDAAFRTETAGMCERVVANGVEAAWIGEAGLRSDKAVLYFHGGGYRIGSIDSHRQLIARIAVASGCRALAINYRLAPEHHFPAPVEDAIAAFNWLLTQGYAPDDIALVGDSAGGGLAVACMLRLRELGIGRPAAGVLMSPWTDMMATGETYVSRAERDPIHQRAMILALARNYLGKTGDPQDPLASPLLADLKELPPLLIQAGDRETVLDDARMFAAKAKAAGVDVQLDVFDGMIHVFQMFPSELEDANKAVAAIGWFLRRHLDASRQGRKQ